VLLYDSIVAECPCFTPFFVISF